jgi:hypothetical protein
MLLFYGSTDLGLWEQELPTFMIGDIKLNLGRDATLCKFGSRVSFTTLNRVNL